MRREWETVRLHEKEMAGGRSMNGVGDVSAERVRRKEKKRGK